MALRWHLHLWHSSWSTLQFAYGCGLATASHLTVERATLLETWSRSRDDLIEVWTLSRGARDMRIGWT
jgi:hypothetical protein